MEGTAMTLINNQNLEAYANDIVDKLNWSLTEHSKLYHDVLQQEDIGKAFGVLEKGVLPWFTRKGRITSNWRDLVEDAVKELRCLNYNLPELSDKGKLNEVANMLAPLGYLKVLRSGSENYVGASKILNFFFPGLIPKIDLFWVKDVCLRKVNRVYPLKERFRISGFTDLQQYKAYLRFASEQDYEPNVLNSLEQRIGVKDAYAVVFEYCLLGFSRQEILAKLENS
jgi:hypothetical protein